MIFIFFSVSKAGGMGENPLITYKKSPFFRAVMYGRNSRVTHPTEYSLPAKLAAGDMEKFR